MLGFNYLFQTHENLSQLMGKSHTRHHHQIALKLLSLGEIMQYNIVLNLMNSSLDFGKTRVKEVEGNLVFRDKVYSIP